MLLNLCLIDTEIGKLKNDPKESKHIRFLKQNTICDDVGNDDIQSKYICNCAISQNKKSSQINLYCSRFFPFG